VGLFFALNCKYYQVFEICIYYVSVYLVIRYQLKHNGLNIIKIALKSD